jgi:hypothetical protein
MIETEAQHLHALPKLPNEPTDLAVSLDLWLPDHSASLPPYELSISASLLISNSRWF